MRPFLAASSNSLSRMGPSGSEPFSHRETVGWVVLSASASSDCLPPKRGNSWRTMSVTRWVIAVTYESEY